jgi:hypothetical protein
MSSYKNIFFEALLIIILNLKTTKYCNIDYVCFVYPPGCQDNSCKFIYRWKNNNNENYTDFTIAGKLEKISNNWLGIGFSTDEEMVNLLII